MHKLVEDYIAQKQAFIEEKKSKEKQKRLYELGLYEKEYAPGGGLISTPGYTMCEYVDGQVRYYRLKSVPVTDEEWEQIEQATWDAERASAADKPTAAHSAIAVALRVIGVIELLLGVIASYSIADPDSWGNGYDSWGSDAVIGILAFLMHTMFTIAAALLLFALAEILNRLAELCALAREGNELAGKGR